MDIRRILGRTGGKHTLRRGFTHYGRADRTYSGGRGACVYGCRFLVGCGHTHNIGVYIYSIPLIFYAWYMVQARANGRITLSRFVSGVGELYIEFARITCGVGVYDGRRSRT